MSCRNYGVNSHFLIGSVSHGVGSSQHRAFTHALSSARNSGCGHAQGQRWSHPIWQKTHSTPTPTSKYATPIHAMPQPCSVEDPAPSLHAVPIKFTSVRYQSHLGKCPSSNRAYSIMGVIGHGSSCGLTKGVGPGYTWSGTGSGIHFIHGSQPISSTVLEFLSFMQIVSKGFYQNGHNVPQNIDYARWDRDANPPLISEITTAEGIRMWIEQQLLNLGRYNQQTFT